MWLADLANEGPLARMVPLQPSGMLCISQITYALLVWHPQREYSSPPRMRRPCQAACCATRQYASQAAGAAASSLSLPISRYLPSAQFTSFPHTTKSKSV